MVDIKSENQHLMMQSSSTTGLYEINGSKFKLK